MFSVEEAGGWVRRTAGVIEENAGMLTKLDAAIGDGDHGTNMARGFKAVLERVEGAGGDFGGLFKAVGMALIGKVGGAWGPLPRFRTRSWRRGCGLGTTGLLLGGRRSSRTRQCWTRGIRR